jgi:DNA invertase Pin-like site-specific DNA recombinase
MKAAIYLRVSTDLQDTERQMTDTATYAKNSGATIIDTYKDHLSGYENENRPELNRLRLLTKEDVDIIYVHEVSRLSRNPTFLNQLVDEFIAKDINIRFIVQQLEVLDSNGQRHLTSDLMLSLFGKNAQKIQSSAEQIDHPPKGHLKVPRQSQIWASGGAN